MNVHLGLAPSIAAARRALAAIFRDSGLDTPDLDARVIIGHALGLEHAALAAQSDRAIPAKAGERIRALAARRIAREPVARIVGAKEFWSLKLSISPAVLVPRPETETLVEAALSLIEPGSSWDLRIADLGTGSGALLLALLHELPGAIGVGTDASPAALAVARDNALRLRLAERASFVACDFGSALAGGFDLVLSNPPYIAAADWPRLAPEVRDHDPRLALDGGADGFAAYRRIAGDAHRLLAPGAFMILELGAGTSSAVAKLFGDRGLAVCGLRPDRNGILRALIVRRPR